LLKFGQDLEMVRVLAEAMDLQYPLDQLPLREVSANLTEGHLPYQH